ncbi:Rne/Rng family ribonuclease [Plantactinospora soyae]|uniref:Ribonuclease E n=1 Tax=Plantactinospora soyae TaxID=1544732 RepID=A0A927ME73_9ACTN|nr:Rne/Rng family ribonuclease [Plantactinospora soyae]MBE1492889.1 ribonuclease E [Plantactinospora soyae]
MLENEPEGGERTGAQPADAAENTGTEAPVRRVRTTRRRTSAASEPTPTGAPIEAPSTARSGSGEAADPEVLAPVAGDTEPAPKTTRRRRKATTADKKDETGLSPAEAAPIGDAGTTAGPTEGTEPGAPAAEAVPPVKVTRTRRKKAAPPPAEPAELAGAPAETTGGATVAGEPAGIRTGGGSEPTGTPTLTGGPTTGSTVGAPAATEPAAGGQSDTQLSGGDGSASVLEPADVPEEAPRGRRRRAALSAPTVLFMAPEPETPPSRAGSPVEPVAVVRPVEVEVEAETGEPAETLRRRRRGRRTTEQAAVELEAEAEAEVTTDEEALDAADLDEDDETAAARRRRRRGRRGRGRGKGTADDIDDAEDEEAATETEAEAEAEEDEDDDAEAGDGVTRRRRRRRRKGAGDTDGTADDGVHTVIKIREPRKTVDEVQGVSGSTRLEAKRQRRRDGREQRRTRPPILSESEFLARREAVDRVMAVRQRGDRTQIAVLEDGVLVEHYVTRASAGTMAGNVYLGKVQNVLPSMEAAFVDVGRGRNAVLYAGEVNWDTTGLEGRARSIEHALRSGDSVLVQVTKDPIGHKGARLTSHIALSGRHLVYVPNGNASGISRKLPDTERKRLRDILKKLVPDGAGVIVRTAAEGASEDELARDVKRLQAQWEDIQAKSAEGGAPVLLYEEPDLVIRVVRDLFNEDFRELVVQGDESYDMVESYLSHVSPDLVPRLRRHTGTGDVFAERRIDEQILKGLDRKVFLPSGGHLVIDRTEAMTVVDVNTGKYTGAGGNLEETVTRNNLEAAEEIVRQLRLRDLGGIVVIDFIDMVLESNRDLVLRRLTECLGRDRTKHQVTEITSLGLVQMTRKRIGAGLLEAFSETCDCCKGRGVIIHTEPVSEKSRPAAVDKVKAVASATSTATSSVSTGASAPTSEAPAVGTRRRGRKAAAPERVVVEATDLDDTMGYDLSRYEADIPGNDDATETEPGEPMRLAGAGDPDGIEDTGDLDAETDTTETGGGRRRARRGGTRRRTRP